VDGSRSAKLRRSLATAVDPRTFLQPLRLLHFYSYSHVRPRRQLALGKGVRLAPNVSIRNGCRIEIGDFSEIGERCYIWAGDTHGKIRIGPYALFGPEVFVTVADYEMSPDVPVLSQKKREVDVTIGRDVWLGARVIVTAGVTVGDGCVVGAASVVTHDLPPYSIAVGAPARVLRRRE